LFQTNSREVEAGSSADSVVSGDAGFRRTLVRLKRSSRWVPQNVDREFQTNSREVEALSVVLLHPFVGRFQTNSREVEAVGTMKMTATWLWVSDELS